MAQGHPKSDKVRVRTSSSLAPLPQGRRSKPFTLSGSWRLPLPPPLFLYFTRLLKWKVLVVWGHTTLDSSLSCFLCFPGHVPSALCSQALRMVGEDHMRMQRKNQQRPARVWPVPLRHSMLPLCHCWSGLPASSWMQAVQVVGDDRSMGRSQETVGGHRREREKKSSP